MATAQRITDIDIWAHLVELTDIERLMDKQAKDELRTQLQRDVPEPTADTVYATLERFALDAGTIFRRGIANAFSGLDRRFRSHDGWKIGGRVILTRMFDDNGWWNYHSNTRDTPGRYRAGLSSSSRGWSSPSTMPASSARSSRPAATVGARGGLRSRASMSLSGSSRTATRICGFGATTLLRQVNKLLAEYYGEVIPQERDPDPDTGFDRVKTTPAKRYGFYPTSQDLADRIADTFQLYRPRERPPLTVLEPQCRDRHSRPEMRPARRPRRLRRAAGPARRRPAGGGDLSPGLAGRLPRHAARFRRPL